MRDIVVIDTVDSNGKDIETYPNPLDALDGTARVGDLIWMLRHYDEDTPVLLRVELEYGKINCDNVYAEHVDG